MIKYGYLFIMFDSLMLLASFLVFDIHDEQYLLGYNAV